MIIEKTKAEIKHETPPFGKPLLVAVFFLFDFQHYRK
jgi:hypothetical protein